MAAELALGAAAIVVAFKGAVETGIFVKSFFDEDIADSSDLGLYLIIEKKRLQIWGELCKVKNPSTCTLRDKPDEIKQLVIATLARIKKLSEDADLLVEKYELGIPAVPAAADDLDKNLDPNSDKVGKLAKQSRKVKAKSRFRWVIHAKDDLKEKIDQIRHHNEYLHKITIEPRLVELLENGLPSRVLPDINNSDDLRALSQLDPIAGKKLGLSALAKLHNQMANADLKGSATRITTSELDILSPAAGIFWLKRPDGTKIIVRVEWNTFDVGPDAQRYSDRIDSLGYILQEVSEPDLRLPPCYGVFHDACDADNQRRIGYVFGLPPDGYIGGGMPIKYEKDIYTHPPIRLSDLIRSQQTQIPLLGDRFQLAYVLACAFSCFHAAKWLHKGFHSGSIFFFQRSGGRIDITEPFISGFQYSRPQGQSSLAYSPLKKSGIQYYYHPDAERSFTKRKDLYSLGVVLCEIGRWVLLSDLKTKPEPDDREGWRDYMLNRILVDLGWRMGEKYQSAVRTLLDCELPDDDISHDYFAEQFLDKVMKSLSSCSA
ncbi:prion-inhibition and propagation-domain-containing protein [Hypoxylon rubiginosum]|uniref:Prion-inhibition and propagation-domain-containing protein n=1 Tax=Hypoxylon rubiginosum TaxID=110542 RepID=A0ACB9YNA8_9PEZI|nr:prion-inhibition and propagation-domain-containing protein [Hypoxylon rubiginosum]